MNPLELECFLTEADSALCSAWNGFMSLEPEQRKDLLAGRNLDGRLDDLIELAVDLRKEMEEPYE